MGMLKNIGLSISARLTAISQCFEDHEAVAEGMIREVERLYAKAKVQQQQIQEHILKKKDEMEMLQREERLWISRIKASQKERALECAKRLKRVQLAIAQVSEELSEAENVKERISSDLHAIQEKLQLVKRKKVELVSRQRCATVYLSLLRRARVPP